MYNSFINPCLTSFNHQHQPLTTILLDDILLLTTINQPSVHHFNQMLQSASTRQPHPFNHEPWPGSTVIWCHQHQPWPVHAITGAPAPWRFGWPVFRGRVVQRFHGQLNGHGVLRTTGGHRQGGEPGKPWRSRATTSDWWLVECGWLWLLANPF